MKNSTIQINEYVLDYNGVRHYLITHGFIGWLIAEKMRSKYQIPKNMKLLYWLKKLLHEHWDLFQEHHQRFLRRHIPAQKALGIEMSSAFVFIIQDTIEKQVIPETSKLAELLDMDEHLLRIFILYGNVPYKIGGSNLVRHATLTEPISEFGTYLKINRRTTLEDIKAELEKIKLYSSAWEKNNDDNKLVGHRRKQITADDDSKVQMYLRVEQSIIELYRGNSADDSSFNFSDEYENKVVSVAFERVAGDLLSEEELSDKEFEEKLLGQLKKIRTIYYEVTKRYSLPTTRDKKAILGLIGI